MIIIVDVVEKELQITGFLEHFSNLTYKQDDLGISYAS